MKIQQQFRLGAFAALFVIVGNLAACQTQMVEQREDKLSAAGFIVRPANTPQRQAMLHRLPPHQFVQRVNGDVVHYVYADPLVCGCLYVGTQQAYNQYKSNQLQQNLVDEQQMTAQTYADANWDWAAWGPWGPGIEPYGFVYGPVIGW